MKIIQDCTRLENGRQGNTRNVQSPGGAVVCALDFQCVWNWSQRGLFITTSSWTRCLPNSNGYLASSGGLAVVRGTTPCLYC